MRYELMAIYRGLAFEAGLGPTDEDVVLFAAGSPPEGLQFQPVAGQWRRQVSRSELDALWESRPVGRYRGHGCLVLDDLGDRLHIAFQGHDAYQAEQLGYWQVDRGVYEVVVPRHDVTDLTELRDDYPPRRAGAVSAAGPVPGDMFGSLPGQASSMPAAAPVASPGAPAPGLPGEALPAAAETRAADPQPGPVPAETAPAEMAPAEALAALATQPQRPMTPDPAGPGRSAQPEPAQEQAARQQDTGQAAAQQQDAPGQAAFQQGPREPAAPRQGAHEQARPESAAAESPAAESAAAELTEPEGQAPELQTPGPASPEPDGPGQAWVAAQVASAGSGSQRNPGQPAPGTQSPGVSGAPDASSHADTAADRTAPPPPAPSGRSGTSLPADMMASAPLWEPAGDNTGRWHPWAPGSDRVSSRESRPAPGANGTNGWNGSGRTAPEGPSSAAGHASHAGTATAPRERPDTHAMFRDLVALAAIPEGSYAVDEDVDGALCLVRTDDGFEVYSSAGNTKHEVRFFEDQESAYFYLFGVLAAGELRSGHLIRRKD